MNILEVRNVGRQFGAFHALRGVDMAIHAREIHGLIGPNGAGKSTLINVVCGLVAPTQGTVIFRNEDITGLAPHAAMARGLARSFQITSIFPGYSVFENVQLALLAQGGHCGNWFRRAAPMLRRETFALLESLDLQRQHARLAGELAAGDRKRLEFAIALAGKPALLLLDEPTAGMSEGERAMVTDLIRTLNAQLGVAVLFTEHDIDMVFSTAHRITVLHQGERIAQGLPAEVRADARVREVYLGDAGGVDAQHGETVGHAEC